jgi:hypothetical protein
VHAEPRPDQVRVVIGDVHAAPEGLRALLREVGAIDDEGNRLDTHFVAQLGDLLHLGHRTGEADLRTLELGTRWIDLQILGNHEGFYTFTLESCWWAGKLALVTSTGKLPTGSVASCRWPPPQAEIPPAMTSSASGASNARAGRWDHGVAEPVALSPTARGTYHPR